MWKFGWIVTGWASPARAVRGTLLLALIGVLCLVLAASALAWRQPTRDERRAIAGVASRTSHAGSPKVHVGAIRVSTVGPWASAIVTIYFEGAPDNAVDILHRVHGRWTIASTGTAGEWCVMPRKDQRNLGFTGAYRCGR